MKVSGKILIAFLACTLASGALLAQTTRGDIQGRVSDEQGQALPGVTVSINSDALIGAQATVTDAQGTYKFLVLPPGAYKVTFSLSGYQTRTQDNIAVKIGSTTRVDSIMTSAFTDEVVVTSESPLVDTSNTSIGVDLSSDFYNSLPTGRNYTSVAKVTPGAQEDASGQTFYGSTGAENAYYIDGANTTGVELGQQGTTLNFEFIDEVQVKTGSYNAEYGRATGSVISVITKSGGNEFHGDVFGYYDAADLQASLAKDPAAGAVSGTLTTVDYTRYDVGLDLGGYFVKDKLWFFAAYDYVSNEDNNEVLKAVPIAGSPEQGDILPDKTTSDLWAAKLTWRIAANHSLSGSAFGDPATQEGALGSLAATPLHYEYAIETGGENYSFNYDGIFGQNVVLSARAAQHNEKSLQTGPGASVVGYPDLTDPLGDGTTVWGWDADSNANTRVSGFGFFQNQEFSRDQYNVDLSWFVGNLAGSHEFKFGYEFEDIGVKNDNWNGGAGQRIYRFTCDPTVRYCGEDGQDAYYFRHRIYLNQAGLDPESLTPADIQAPLTVDTKAENAAWFVQDTWQVTSNLSLALGVRFGSQKLFNGDGGVSADIDDNIAPRLGFVWDPTGNGKSKVFGHWGKFYETIPMDIVIRSFGGEISIFSYNLSDDPNDVANDPAVRSARPLGGGFSNVDPGIKGQHLEEWVVGFEYEFAPDWAAGIKYIDRSLKRVIEDALSADGNYYIGNPSYGLMTGTYDIGYAYGYNSDLCDPSEGGSTATCPNYHVIPTPTREFDGIELTLKKRFSNNFQFITSFLWSDLTGNYDGTFQASTGQLDPNLNSAFDYADFQVNNTGNLSNDIPFQFKFDGIYRFNFGLSLGLSAYYTDGTPITAMGYSFAYNNWEFYLSDRGAFGKSDAYYEADLHLGYPVKLGSTMELNFLVDIFNLFNMQGETGRSIRYTTGDFQYDVIDWSTGEDIPPIVPGDTERPVQNPAFNTANAWQDPFTVRLGVRLSF
jgi:hypothetical protein